MLMTSDLVGVESKEGGLGGTGIPRDKTKAGYGDENERKGLFSGNKHITFLESLMLNC